MDLIVVSPENAYPNEHLWVCEMFEAGLGRYHLRKPGWEDAEVERYLVKIPRDWRSRVVLHQYHGAVKKYNLGGWHFKDRPKQLKLPRKVKKEANSCKTLSRAIHRLEDLNEDLTLWDYVFISPVYRSLTKANYGPRWERTQLETAIRRCKELNSTKLYALGGIEPANLLDCALMGFDGVALMGAIWSSRYPIRSFREAKEAISQPALT